MTQIHLTTSEGMLTLSGGETGKHRRFIMKTINEYLSEHEPNSTIGAIVMEEEKKTHYTVKAGQEYPIWEKL